MTPEVVCCPLHECTHMYMHIHRHRHKNTHTHTHTIHVQNKKKDTQKAWVELGLELRFRGT